MSWSRWASLCGRSTAAICAQGHATALLRAYARDIHTQEDLWEPDDSPLARRVQLWPAAVFGADPLYPPAAQRTPAPLEPVADGSLDPVQLAKEQQLLLDYARCAVTEENVDALARRALAARREVAASVLAQENPGDFARIIGLHTYSRSPRRCYEVQPLGVWVQQAGFRFEDFLLTRRKEEQDDD